MAVIYVMDASYLSEERNWKSVLPSATSGEFHVTDLLTFAGVASPLNYAFKRPATVIAWSAGQGAILCEPSSWR